MRKSILLVLIAICFFAALLDLTFADGVSIKLVRKVAEVHLQVQNLKEQFFQDLPKAEYSIKDIKSLRNESGANVLAYIVNLNPKGYIVISPDTDIRTIIAYSFTSDFIFKDSPENALLHIVTQDLKNRLEYISFISDDIIVRNNDLWTKYLQRDGTFLLNLAAMPEYGPWLTTNWNQSAPYNGKCPIDISTGNRCITGCVALAMGQVLNYWQYPPMVHFDSAESYITATRSIFVDATTASMDTIDWGSGDASVFAGVLFACGVRIQADYGPSATAGNVQADDFTYKFKYAKAVDMTPSDSNFHEKLEENMKDGAPAPLSMGRSAGGPGHCVVCDGYRDSGEFHLNFGWGGSTNGWYFIPGSAPAGYDIVNSGVLNLFAPHRPPQVIHVPRDYSTLAEAICEAFSGAYDYACDTIVISDGRHAGETFSGIDFIGKTLVIKSQSGAEACTLDLMNLYMGFYFRNEEPRGCMIDGITIINGSGSYGGAIECAGKACPTIQNCVISNCAAGFGGAIGIRGHASPCIRNNKIIGNHTSNYGGGIYCENADTPIIVSNTIEGNDADDAGGGIYCVDTDPIIWNNVIKHNVSISSAGIHLLRSNAEIVNNMIVDNSATGLGDIEGGGGIYLRETKANIINSTIANNQGGFGGGIFAMEHSQAVLLNVILWQNLALSGGNEIFLKWIAGSSCSFFIDHSDVDQYACLYFTPNNIGWGTGNIFENPDFADANYHLSEASECVDVGGASVISPFTSLVVDAPRMDFEYGIRPHDTGYDIGADEYGTAARVIEFIRKKPDKYLISAYPNPFNSSCRIYAPKDALIEIYDLRGNLIWTNASVPVINNSILWQPEKSVCGGIYVARVTSSNNIEIGKLIYLK